LEGLVFCIKAEQKPESQEIENTWTQLEVMYNLDMVCYDGVTLQGE